MYAPTVLAVDGGSLAHRAWHALRGERLGGAWVTGGVVRMLASAWWHGPFDGIVLALDSTTSVRRQRCPEYKAHRPPTDPALLDQLEELAAIAAAAGFEVVGSDGYEADDLLAATVLAARRAGARCALLSSDRDLLALVGPNTALLRPRSRMADLKVYGPAEVEEEFGVPPARYLELAALRGDTADGLCGVPGIGARTAARLLASFGDLETLYAGLHHLDPPLRRRLLRWRPTVERNLELMAPLGSHEVDIARVLERGIDLDRAVSALTAAGLEPAATALRLAVQRPPPPPLAPPAAREAADHARPDGRPPRQPRSRPAARDGQQVPLFEV